jgi:hypothetical protein
MASKRRLFKLAPGRSLIVDFAIVENDEAAVLDAIG